MLNNVYSDTFTYDTKNGLYVLLNTASTQGQDRVYFTSPNLIDWTADTVGIWQNYHVVFAPDGRAVMGNIASIETLMSRTQSGDWENVTALPGTGTYKRYRDILFANERFHALVYDYDVSGEGDDKEVIYNNLFVGYSDDLSQWTWRSISTDENEILALSALTALAANQITISSGSYSYSSRSLDHFYVSSDNGALWNKSASPLSILNISDSMHTSTHSYFINSLINHNGTTYGKLTMSGENGFYSENYFSTTDFTNFTFEFTANDSKLFTFNDSLYINAAARNVSWVNYRKVDSAEVAERVILNAEALVLAAVQEAILAAINAVEAAKIAETAAQEAQAAKQAVKDAFSDAQKQKAVETAEQAYAKADAAVEAAAVAVVAAQAALQTATLAAVEADTDTVRNALSEAAAAVQTAQEAEEAADDFADMAEDSAQDAAREANEEDNGLGSLGFFELLIVMFLASRFMGRRKKLPA